MERKRPEGRNRDKVITLLRKANTRANEKYGIGGRPKRIAPPPITLPRLKRYDDEENTED